VQLEKLLLFLSYLHSTLLSTGSTSCVVAAAVFVCTWCMLAPLEEP
jgi:hypothetical protein